MGRRKPWLTLERAWLEVIEEESAKDETFKKIADSYLSFRQTYAIWGDAQLLKGTYSRRQQARSVAGLSLLPGARPSSGENHT